MHIIRAALAVLVTALTASAQTPTDPFPKPIPTDEGVIRLKFVEFATLPDNGGDAARMMLLVDEPGTRRLFVNDMKGPLYAVSYDGKAVTRYLDVNAPEWGHPVNFTGAERGFQSFAFHPEFNKTGARGFGKFYTYADTSNMTPPSDFLPGGGNNTQDTVLLEWTAKSPAAATYDGGLPRELMRFRQPYGNHNGGQLGFNPLAPPGSADYGLLYIGSADGGSGGDPLELAQNLGSAFGKMLRIDPLGSNSKNGKYGVPNDNPYANDGKDDTLGEIYASGLRNPQRFCWDSKTGRLFVADIGQNVVEEVSIVTRGADLGWNDWEGSFRFLPNREVNLEKPRSDPKITYPVVEYGQPDPLFLPNAAVTMGYAYRGSTLKQLTGKLLFGDNPSGEVFHVSADNLPTGGQDPIRRILFDQAGEAKTLLQLIQQTNEKQGKKPATRADLRFGEGPQSRLFVLNKRDGVIREIVP